MASQMKKFIAVIGNTNSGKSTIIQSLTGCRTRNYRGRVTDLASGKEIEVIASSPQENPMSQAQLKKMMKNVARRPQSVGLIIAIQPTTPRKRLCMEDIFAIALQHRLAPYAFVLALPYKGTSTRIDIHEVERRLATSRVPVQVINGKRFAHLNASIIRDVAGLL
jgi:energy-coupling factor transporter ATP-binding protein EcfA2